MQSEQHIRRLVRELELPEQATLVIQRPKYWTPAFCWRFFERCDDLIFDDPQAGLQAAEVAPELVSLVRKFSRDPGPRAALSLRALAVLGSAFRAVGDLELSAETYRDAYRLLKKELVPEIERANLFLRVSVLRNAQHRLAEALKLATAAVDIYRDSSDEVMLQYLGEALTNRGYCYFQAGEFAAAMKDWSEALSCTDPRRSPRIYQCAFHNLVCGLVARTIDSRSLSVIESYLRQARRCLSRRPRSVQKLRLIWLEGMIMIRFGSTRRGEAALVTARTGFIEMEAPFDLALVSIALGRYFFQSRQVQPLRDLATETQRLFGALCSDNKANQALVVWRDTILARTASIQAFAAAWRAVQERAGIVLEAA